MAGKRYVGSAMLVCIPRMSPLNASKAPNGPELSPRDFTLVSNSLDNVVRRYRVSGLSSQEVKARLLRLLDDRCKGTTLVEAVP